MSWFNKTIATLLPYVPKSIVGFFSRNYIAGETLEDARRVVKNLNNHKVCATIDVLGEEIQKKGEALQALEMYKQVLQDIDRENLNSNISVKPTHLGLKIGKEFCFNNFKILLEEAQKYKNFVRIDMEDSSCIDDTIELCLNLKKEYDSVGTVIQAYMRRSEADVKMLAKKGVGLRICKGIYNEPKQIAFKHPDEIRDNFKKLVEIMLDHGVYIGIATHDNQLIDHAYDVIARRNLQFSQYEFQMLLGVKPDVRRSIVSDGHCLRVYVPFGEEWFGYSTRRLKENPAIAGHIMKNIFRKGFKLNQ